MNNEEEKEQAALWETASKSEGEEKVDALVKLSYHAFHRGDHDESLALCETARDEYEKLGAAANNSTLAHIYFGIGYSLRHLKRHADSALALDKSAALYRDMGSEEANHVMNEEGFSWYDAKEYLKSYESYKIAIEAANPDTCDSMLAKNYADAGTALLKLKRWSEALHHFMEARKIYKKLKDLRQIVHCDEEISLCYVRLDNGMEAIHYAQLALDYAVTAEDEYHLMWANARLALAKKTTGEFDEALELFAKAKSMMVGLDNPPWKAVLKLEKQVSDIYVAKGQFTEANEILRRIESLKEIVLDEGEELI